MGSSNSKKKGEDANKTSQDDSDIPTPEKVANDEKEATKKNKSTGNHRNGDTDSNGAHSTDSDGADSEGNQRNGHAYDEDDDTVYPPSSFKSESLQLDEYQKIDKHAMTTKLAVADQGFEQLVSHLSQPAADEMGKVRALFTWLTSQTRDAVLEFYVQKMTKAKSTNEDLETPLPALYEFFINKNPGRLPQAFQTMCKFAGFQSHLVNTNAKSVDFPDFELPAITETTSTIVRVDRQWQHIDVIRAMGVTYEANEEDDDEFKPVPSEMREYWFLTDPAEMIFFQFPEQREHQLLHRPVAEVQFAKMGAISPYFFQLGIKSIKPAGYLVESTDGIERFELGLESGNKISNFKFDLSKSLHDQARNFYDGKDLKDFVTVEHGSESVKFTVSMPWIGKYKLDIKAPLGKSHKTVISYYISCTKPCFYANPSPFPNVSFGLTPKASELGLEPVDHDPGLIKVREGFVQMKYRMNKKSFLFSTSLQGEDESADDGNGVHDGFIRHYIHDDIVTFVFKATKRGIYLLTLKAMLKKGFGTFAFYQLEVERGSADLSGIEFPEHISPQQNCQIGDLQDEENRRIKSAGQENPIIQCPESGDMKITMMPTDSKIQKVEFMLKFHGVNCIEDLSMYVLQYSKGDSSIKFYFMFPKAGLYTFEIYDRDPNEDDPVGLYQYIIHVTKPMVDCFPIPKFLHWEDGLNIYKPTQGYLKAQNKYKAKFRVPRATNVNIAGHTDLKRSKDDIWQGEFTTGETGGQLYVYATFKDGEQSKELFLYTVQDDTEMEDHVARQELSKRESEAQHREAEALRVQEDQRVSSQKQARERDLANREKDFYANRKQYEQEERKVQQEENEKDQEKTIYMADKRRSRKTIRQIRDNQDKKEVKEDKERTIREKTEIIDVENRVQEEATGVQPEEKKQKRSQPTKNKSPEKTKVSTKVKEKEINVKLKKPEAKDRKRKPPSETSPPVNQKPEKGKTTKLKQYKLPVKPNQSEKKSPTPKTKKIHDEPEKDATFHKDPRPPVVSKSPPAPRPGTSKRRPNTSTTISAVQVEDDDSDDEAVANSRLHTDGGSTDYELGRDLTIDLSQVIKRRKRAFNYQHPAILLLNESDEWLV